MKNLFRALIYNEQVSLTVADTTKIVKEGIRLHKLTPASAYYFGKALSALAYFSSALKEEKGEISLAIQCDGEIQSIGASGNRALQLRGYIQNTAIEGVPAPEKEPFGLGNGYITVVRDDGYNRPFVGTCAFPENGNFDGLWEEYFLVSEQLPTRIATVVELDEKGDCLFAGVIALQPLPFAEEETLQRVADLPLYEILKKVKTTSLEEVIGSEFALDVEKIEGRVAKYECNCSRQRLAGVLITLGEGQLRDIIATEGEVRAHCHYCNTDYAFTSEDVDELFSKK